MSKYFSGETKTLVGTYFARGASAKDMGEVCGGKKKKKRVSQSSYRAG